METAKLIIDGDSQSVQLPPNIQLEGEEVYIKKIGKVVLLVPVDESWLVVEESLTMFSDGFMGDREQPDIHARNEDFE